MEENKRKSISKKIRFEVFKRDSFTCQYCGKKAPDVVLEVDHINPVSKGGKNELSNLITSFFDCNRGKGNRKINENATVKIQQQQLELLNKKREQLEMMVQWKDELQNLKELEIDKISDFLSENASCSLTDTGRKNFKKLITEFGFDEVYESLQIAFDTYYAGDNADSRNKEYVISKVGGICNNRKMQRENPILKDINGMVKCASYKFSYCDKKRLRNYLLAYVEEQDIQYIFNLIQSSRNWTDMKSKLEDYLGGDL